MTWTKCLAALAASCLLILTACSGNPQDEFAKSLNESLRKAAETFANTLKTAESDDEITQPVGHVLRETGHIGSSEPITEEYLIEFGFIEPWGEQEAWEICSSGSDPDECMMDSRSHHQTASAAAAAEHARAQRGRFTGWGFWAGMDDEMLFEAVLYGTKYPPPCPPEADCLPGGVYARVSGTPTGTNPVSGSAVWSGFARAVVGDEVPIAGKSRLEANLGASTLDVHLTELGAYSHVWRKLDLVDGGFSREAGSWMLEGAFYGDEHEGAAGRFNHGASLIGVFGALRETE